MKWPWSNMRSAHCIIVLHMCAKSFPTVINSSRVIKRTGNTVIQCLTLIYGLYLEPTLVKQTHCKSTHHTWHMSRIIGVSHQTLKRYRTDMQVCMTFNFDLGVTLVKYMHCTPTYHTWHLWRVICKAHQYFKRYSTDTLYSHKMCKLKPWPWPWTDLGQTCLSGSCSGSLQMWPRSRWSYCLIKC